MYDMNEKIIQSLVKIEVNYDSFIYDIDIANDFVFFLQEYEHYYKKIEELIISNLKKQLMLVKNDRVENYLPYIKKNWRDFFKKQVLQNSTIGSSFLQKLSVGLLSDFSHLSKAYEKSDSKLKDTFLNQFLEKKTNSITILFKNNIDLALYTLSQINSPYLQFKLLQVPEIQKEIIKYLEKASTVEVCIMLCNYFSYPRNTNIKEYLYLWNGQKSIHVKFCKNIFGQYYNQIKTFLKQKNEHI